MVKVLVYSSKELYDKSSYEGRAEAHIIAYRIADSGHMVVKDRTGRIGCRLVYGFTSLKHYISFAERDEFDAEYAKHLDELRAVERLSKNNMFFKK